MAKKWKMLGFLPKNLIFETNPVKKGGFFHTLYFFNPLVFHSRNLLSFSVVCGFYPSSTSVIKPTTHLKKGFN